MSELDWLDDDDERGLESTAMTNTDKIRSMTDRELAEWLDEHDDQEDFCNTRCPYYDGLECTALEPNSCFDGRLEWLRQLHKSNAI